MVKRRLTWVPFAMALVLTTAAACTGGDGEGERRVAPVSGTFVGKLSGTNAFVAVVASPAGQDRDQRDVAVYVSDGTRLSEWFPSSVPGNSFAAASDDGDAQVKGEVNPDSVTGTVKLPDGQTVRYEASRAAGAAGLYNLTFSSDGKLRGATPAGVGLTGNSTLPKPGTGTLKLADGKSLKFAVAANPEADPMSLRAGQMRLIVLPDGELIGVGRNLPTKAAEDSGFFVRRAAK